MRRLRLGTLSLLVCATVSCSSQEQKPPATQEPRSATSATVESVVSPDGQSTPDPPDVDDAESALLYLEKKTLRLFHVRSDESETLDKLSSADAVANQDGSLIAYATSSAPTTGEEDFIAQPELHIYEVSSGRDVTVGPGFSPLWHPDGAELAYLEPQDARVCEGEACEGGNSLVVAGVEDNSRKTILDSGAFALLGWSGDQVIVSQQEPNPATVAVSMEGDVESLSIEPSEFWGASPDGRWIVRSITGRVELHAVSGSKVDSFPLPDAVLAEGSWSPDSSRLVSVSVDVKGGGSTQLIQVDVARKTFSPVPDSQEASGPVLWSTDGTSFVYVRAAGGRGLDLEAVRCELSLDNREFRCRPLFSWPRGVTLLALS